MTTTGILVFDGVEELDAVGPWEVLAAGRRDGDAVLAVGPSLEPVTAAKGLRLVPDVDRPSCPALDVLVVPGGVGARRSVDDEDLVAWIRDRAATATWVTSVCTGAFLLHAAGVTTGRRVTTHWAWVDALREAGAEVVTGERWVVDGNVVTAAGVSAGIDMALWLLGELHGEEHRRAVQRSIEYDPAPPY